MAFSRTAAPDEKPVRGAMSSAAPSAATEKKKIEISHTGNREGRSDKRRGTSHAGEMSLFEVGKGTAQPGGKHLDHGGGNCVWRSNEDVVTASTIHATLHRICHHTRFEHIFLNSPGHVRVGRKRFARLRVADDFDGEEQALAPHVSDDRVLPKRFERRPQLAPDRFHALKKPLPLDIVEHRVSGRGSHRMRVIRKTVEEGAGA